MYQVLARKYRPRNFYELVGQQHVSKALTSALERGRLHHAYLFTGTRGVGKTTIARILAKCLNCETGVTATPCEQCNVCQAVNEGRFIDLIEIDAASRTKVEDTRELLDNVPYAPTQGRFKVYLIDEVHMLSTHSFNALLKTLEEPPAHVKFLFATTDPQKLPITVISRCLQFTLRPLTIDEIHHHLDKLLTLEDIPHDEPALWQLANSAQGSLRDALSLTDQAIAYGQGQVYQQDVKEMLGLIDRHLVYDLLLAVHQNQRQQVAELLLLFRQQAIDVALVLEQLITTLHELALLQYLPNLTLNYTDEIKQKILQLAQHIAPQDIQLYYQICCKGRDELNLAITPMQGFEMCILRLLAFRPLAVGEFVAVEQTSQHIEHHQELQSNRGDDVKHQVEQVADILISENIESPQEQIEENVVSDNVEYLKEQTVENIVSDHVESPQKQIEENIVSDNVEYLQEQIVESIVSEHVESSQKQIEEIIVTDNVKYPQEEGKDIPVADEIEYSQEVSIASMTLQDVFNMEQLIAFVDDDLIDIFADSSQQSESSAVLQGYLYFDIGATLWTYHDISPIPEHIMNAQHEKMVNVDEERSEPSLQDNLSSTEIVEAVLEENISSEEMVSEPVLEENISSEEIVSEPILTEQASTTLIPVSSMEHDERSPQEILALSEQQLLGAWTDEKWEYWLRHSALSPAVQGILQHSVMQGDIAGESHLLIQQDYVGILEQFTDDIIQHLAQLGEHQQTHWHYVEQLPAAKTPLMLEQQRKILAHQQAERWLQQVPTIAQLLQQFNGQIQEIDLGVSS